jgi:nucleotide-binding universal stress UspA family protein
MKIEIKKILCPIDFSKNAEHAFGYALAFAIAHHAKLEVLHILELPTYASPDFPITPEFSTQTVTQLKESGRKQLEKLVAKYESEYSDISWRMVVGTPFVEIVKTAKNDDVDLIVMGTHGRTGISHLLIGSVAERVVRKSPCPVLTVKSPEHEFIMI